MLGVVGVDRCAQVFKPSTGGLIRHCAFAWRNAGALVILIRRAGRPVDKVAAELRLELGDLFGAEKRVEIEQAD